MHLLDSYALNCAAKIDKPYVYETYYPLGEERYITLQPQSKFKGKQYSYWNEVIDFLHPELEKADIRVVQMGNKDDAGLHKCIWSQGTTSLNQASYLIRGSMLHLGVDSFAIHVASGLGKKIVGLYSTNWAENCKPYWSDPKDVVLLEPDRSDKKPSFKYEDDGEQVINEIKPESIASATLELLGLKSKIPYETLYIGDAYRNFNIQTIPTKVSSLPIEMNQVVIRMDVHHDEDNLAHQLQQRKMDYSIISSKAIEPKILLAFRDRIQEFVYLIDENHNPDFVKFLHKSGINYVLITEMNDEELNKIKLYYLDYSFIFQTLVNQKDKKKILSHPKDKLLFKSNKTVLEGGSYYNSVASYESKLKKPTFLQKDFAPLIDSPRFWNELRDFHVVKKLD